MKLQERQTWKYLSELEVRYKTKRKGAKIDSPKGLKTGVVNLLFMEGEAEDFGESIQYLESLCRNSETYIAKYSEFDQFLQNMGYLKEKLNIKNHAALILYLVSEKREAMENGT